MKPHSAWLVVALFSALACIPIQAQDTSIGDHAGSVFVEASLARSGEGAGNIWGGSAGAYLQRSPLGVVLRGTVLPGNPEVHVYDAILGPRILMNLPFVHFYVEAGGGTGHASFYNTSGAYGASWGAAWQVDGGITRQLNSRIDWRVLEVGDAHIYAGSGVSALIFNTGFSVHFW